MSEAVATTDPADALPFDALAVPSADGDARVVPPVRDWPAMIERNRALRETYDFDVDGASISDLARAARTAPPRLFTGHQPEFFHPGVWIKNVLAARVAATLSGRSCYLIVDNDAPHGTALRIPVRGDDGLTVRALAPPWGAAETSFEQLPAESDQFWRRFFNETQAAGIDAESSGLAAFADAFSSNSNAPPTPGLDARASTYVRRFASGLLALDRAIGVATPDIGRVGHLAAVAPADAPSWCRFVTHLVRHAPRFAADYNAALHAYRAIKGIAGTRHPIPDLHVDADRIELPLWAWRGAEPRKRLFVSNGTADAVSIFADSARVGTLSTGSPLSEDGCLDGWHVRPRALTLTLYVRLFLCDLFIHGIGGAKYDAMTDRLIRRFFGVRPPEYACATATMRLPLIEHPVTNADVDRAARRIREVIYNPQRALADAGATADSTREFQRLTRERGEAVAESTRLRAAQRDQHAARRRIFRHIRALNDQIRALTPAAESQARARHEELRARRSETRIAMSREWFYGLHSSQRLCELVDRAT
jgi:hypothetical protein